MGERDLRELGVYMYPLTLLYLKWITNKGLLYSTGNFAQCYVEAWMGGEFVGEQIHVHVCAKSLPSCLTVRPYGLQPASSPWNSPGQNTGVGCHFHLQIQNKKLKTKTKTPKDLLFLFYMQLSFSILAFNLELYLYTLITYSGQCQIHSLQRREPQTRARYKD